MPLGIIKGLMSQAHFYDVNFCDVGLVYLTRKQNIFVVQLIESIGVRGVSSNGAKIGN
jgi:hypothetical protein